MYHWTLRDLNKQVVIDLGSNINYETACKIAVQYPELQLWGIPTWGPYANE